MPENFSILTIILTSIFIGFGFIIPVVALIRTSNLKRIAFKQLFILTAIQTVRIAGIFYFLLFCVDAYFEYKRAFGTTDMVIVQSPLFGKYWMFQWFVPVFYLVLSQLFWLKKLYTKKAALITLALLLLFLPSKRFMLIITNLTDREALQPIITNAGPIVIEFSLNIIVFVFAVFAVMAGTGKLKKLAE